MNTKLKETPFSLIELLLELGVPREEIDDYCCENEWDTICQLTYDYCDSSYVGEIPTRKSLNEEIIVYPNPTNGIVNINKNVDINVFNYIGDMIISKQNINVLDVTILTPGIYTLQIEF